MAAATAPTAPAAGRRERLAEPLRTTPGRLRLAAALIAIGAVLFGVVGTSAVSHRRAAARSAATVTEPLLVTAEGLYASLSDADATAATTFLTGGLEPPARRQRYAADLRSASEQFATLARQATASGPTSAAVRTIATELPVYTGLVETARANNRQGYPVGAAYLRQASALMREQLLPAANRLYEVEARRLSHDYRSGVSSWTIVAVIAIAALMLGLLIVVQVALARLTHRTFNVPLVLASVIVLGLAAWMLTALVEEQNALSRAQHTGSDPVQVLSAARVMALRAQGDEGLALVARGGGEASLQDFQAATARLGSSSQASTLLGVAAQIASSEGSAGPVQDLSSSLAEYLSVHRRVAALETNGRFNEAVALAVGPTAQELPISDALNSGIGEQISAAQSRFSAAASDATSSLGGLWLAIPLLTVLFAALALFGVQLRLKEYR